MKLYRYRTFVVSESTDERVMTTWHLTRRSAERQAAKSMANMAGLPYRIEMG